jgi:hypothetical protein
MLPVFVHSIVINAFKGTMNLKRLHGPRPLLEFKLQHHLIVKYICQYIEKLFLFILDLNNNETICLKQKIIN